MQVSTGSANFGNTPSRHNTSVINISFDGQDSGSTFGDSNEVWKLNTYTCFDAFNTNAESIGGAVVFGYGRGIQTTFNLSASKSQAGINSVSSVYIDLADVPGTVMLVSKDSGQRIVARGGTQGWYPVIASTPQSNDEYDLVVFDAFGVSNNVTRATLMADPQIVGSFGGILPTVYGRIRLSFVDIDMPAATWDVKNSAIATWFDHSGTITGAGAFQIVMSPQLTSNSAVRYGFLIQNPLAAVEPLYLGFRNSNPLASSPVLPTIANSIGLLPGQIYREMGLPCTQNSIRLMAATAGHAFIAKELR